MSSSQVSVLLIDNFDSFTFNLVDELASRGARVEVWRNDVPVDKILERLEAMAGPRLLVLSPGPGTPTGAGSCIELIKRLAGEVPIVGICLGHQAIVEAFGGRVVRSHEVMHGKASAIEHDGTGLFQGLPRPFRVGRYHSLVAQDQPEELRVSAYFDDIIMAVEHRDYPVVGVQFHPESILTPHGHLIFQNLLAWAAASGGQT
ncbi:MAG: aminodeoxychorismate/anthranilate synthase component II [Bradymonadaceae bacterium]